MKRIELRDATKEDVHQWYKGPPPVSMRAQVLDVDGEIMAIWGVQNTNGDMVCFSHIKPEARLLKREVVKGIRMLRKLLQEYPHVIAFASKDEPTSEAFIRHVGFTHIASSSQGEIYTWP